MFKPNSTNLCLHIKCEYNQKTMICKSSALAQNCTISRKELGRYESGTGPCLPLCICLQQPNLRGLRKTLSSLIVSYKIDNSSKHSFSQTGKTLPMFTSPFIPCHLAELSLNLSCKVKYFYSYLLISQLFLLFQLFDAPIPTFWKGADADYKMSQYFTLDGKIFHF